MVMRAGAIALVLGLLCAGGAGAQGLAPATTTAPFSAQPPPGPGERIQDVEGGTPNRAPDRPAPPAPTEAEGPAALDPALASLEFIVDTPHADTHVDEMILARVRGVYTVTIALEELKQPSLANFGWQQLGRDSWTTEFIEGKSRTVFERRLALYPSRPGTLPIEPFVHRLTVSDGGAREVRTVSSAPATIEAAAVPAEMAGQWWLPASRLTYTDEWDRDPASLPSGEVATRTVTIEALGIPASRLPPRPKMLAEWLITFAQPEERSQTITPDGPLARIVWRWRMRPVSSEPGRLPAHHIPWFDTQARAMRDVVLPSQRIAVEGVLAVEPEPSLTDRLAEHVPALAALGGFATGVLVLLPGRRRLSETAWRALIERAPLCGERGRLRRAVWRGDAMAARRAARRILATPRRGGEAERRAATEALSALDAALFGRAPQAPTAPLLGALSRAVRRIA